MNHFYRNFEIERQADGWWVKDRGVYKFEAHATLKDAERRIDKHICMLLVEEWQAA